MNAPVTGPYVLWITQAQRLKRPDFILCPGTLKSLRDWKQRNLWAASISTSWFGSDRDGVFFGQHFMNCPDDNNVPCKAENVPAEAWGELWGLGKDAPVVNGFTEQQLYYGGFVERVGRALRLRGVRVVWTVCADDDGGVCALWAAKGLGLPVVALASTPPGILAFSQSLQTVPISFRERSGDGLML